MTIEQALADYSYLVAYLKEKYNAANAPVIAFGGRLDFNFINFLQKTMLLYIFLYLHRKDVQVIIFICFISQHFYSFIFVFAHNHLEVISFVQIEIKRVAE